MRRRLAINVDFLRPSYQEQLRYRSNQNLVEPWAIDETETMTNKIAYLYADVADGQAAL